MTFSARQRVLVVNTGSVFDTSVAQLLELASDLEVAEIELNDDGRFLEAVADFEPGTIVVNDSEQADAAHLLQLLKDHQPAYRLRVLVIRMSDNTIEQYEFRQVVATDSADLAALIRSE
jgi:DNA-binding NarL/FixJ family response regulator